MYSPRSSVATSPVSENAGGEAVMGKKDSNKTACLCALVFPGRSISDELAMQPDWNAVFTNDELPILSLSPVYFSITALFLLLLAKIGVTGGAGLPYLGELDHDLPPGSGNRHIVQFSGFSSETIRHLIEPVPFFPDSGQGL